MFKKRAVKRETKKFDNFTKEEQWLQQLLQDGWILTNYDSDDTEENCDYVFEPIKHEEQKEGTYKIDYRSFSNEDDFEEYISLFEETKWTVIKKKLNEPRRIFYTEIQNKNSDIFSDSESYIEREKERMSNSLQNIIIGTSMFIILFILYLNYRITSFGGVSFITLFSTIPSMISYYKHRKAYKSLVAQQN
ncbi:DUF2812 domain-containing protein [Priestia taiwanensis]|uniref:DUF2812 domain-containing protein n=1 Tax=Priestia taiwanensis TaxID=1347902 RepID=A0A917ATS5_9BACI|nr:DUF2812 domain-containing protein [Priestia taiwanensis]MBM7364142.1 hypothetical protein [Priestia taiwanensis]GGE71907.1 hypothetical protein GCM10007140_22360 [Priestia taiwanensis]